MPRVKNYKYPKNPGGINSGNELEGTSCPIPKEELRRLYELPRSAVDIAKQIHFGYGAVYIWLRRIGVTIRNSPQEPHILRNERGVTVCECLECRKEFEQQRKGQATCSYRCLNRGGQKRRRKEKRDKMNLEEIERMNLP